MAELDIITLQQAKLQLNITSATHDTEIEDYVSAATAMVEDAVGPVVPRDIIEVQHGGRLLVLHRPPVIDLLTLVPVLIGGVSYTPADLDVDADTGIVRRLDGGGFVGPLRVTYEAGRDPVPGNMNLATRIIVGHLWVTQRGAGNPGMRSEDELVPSGLGYAVPRRAMELLAPDRRAPVLA